MPNNKTVIILGAGFSASSGLMTQDGMLGKLNTWVSSRPIIAAKWNSFSDFFNKAINGAYGDYLIEDVFTILDKSIIDNRSYKGFSANELIKARDSLVQVIQEYFVEEIQANFQGKKFGYNDYMRFAKLVSSKRYSYGTEDKLAIISLNWDYYLEHAFDKIRTSVYSGKSPKLQVDYCVYENTMSGNTSIPSLLKKASGICNLKVLKPHGSVNWGICPECERLYITLGVNVIGNFHCKKYCSKAYKRNIELKQTIITPTFLKTIEGTHLDSIWHNSSIEISEADTIIFIGYSLRPEDYYFRYLLSRNTKKNTQIDVYDFTSDTDPIRRQEYEKSIRDKFSKFFTNSNIRAVEIDGWQPHIPEIISSLP